MAVNVEYNMCYLYLACCRAKPTNFGCKYLVYTRHVLLLSVQCHVEVIRCCPTFVISTNLYLENG